MRTTLTCLCFSLALMMGAATSGGKPHLEPGIELLDTDLKFLLFLALMACCWLILGWLVYLYFKFVVRKPMKYKQAFCYSMAIFWFSLLLMLIMILIVGNLFWGIGEDRPVWFTVFTVVVSWVPVTVLVFGKKNRFTDKFDELVLFLAQMKGSIEKSNRDLFYVRSRTSTHWQFLILATFLPAGFAASFYLPSLVVG